MKESVKEQWLTALRSGNYKQTSGRLHDEDGFCCLGVLCDIAVKNKVIPDPIVYEWDRRIHDYSGEESVLPKAVRLWAGLDSPNPTVEHHGSYQNLAALNDSGGTFVQLADLIEDQL